MTLYICPVGTSIGGFRPSGMRLEEAIALKLSSKREEHGDDLRAFLIAASAETNVLARRDCGPADEVLLLISDTDDGRICGESLRDLIVSDLGAKVRLELIGGLQVAHEAAFRERGLRTLVRKVRAAARTARAQGDDVVFNITGGYKGVVPYMTLLGMFEKAEILYVFQEIDALIRLPALPLRMDTDAIAAALPTLQALRDTMMDEARFDELGRRAGWAGNPRIELLFERDDGQVCLSAAGELALEAPSQSRRRGRLFVHRRAHGELGNQKVTQALPDLNDPELRRIPLHRQGHGNTDLLIWKIQGQSAPRMFYWCEDDDVWLADILSHDDYKPKILDGRAPIWRINYAPDQFEEMEIVDGAGADPYPAALAEFIEVVDSERASLAQQGEELEKRLGNAHRRAEREHKARDEAIEDVLRAKGAVETLTRPPVVAAAAFAAHAHRDQKRKDAAGTPYVEHLITVAKILALEGGVTDTDLVAAGYLHDIIEDQSVPGDELETRFGVRVRSFVEAVSDDKSLDKEERKRLQVEHAPHASPDVALLKFADKIANLRDLVSAPPAAWSPDRLRGYVSWARDVGAGLRGRGTARHERLEAAFDAACEAADRIEFVP
jgi:guanosine-3',5'-bis(diphosphate) 3'-pyrophosphohydrolase